MTGEPTQKAVGLADDTPQQQCQPARPKRAASPRRNGTSTRKTVAAPEPLPSPSPKVQEAIEQAGARHEKRGVPFQLKQTLVDGTMTIGPRHSDTEGYGRQFLDAFGTRSVAFAHNEVNRLLIALGPDPRSYADEEKLNAALAVVAAVKPEDEIEAMLATQMAMTHALTMQAMTRAHRAEFQAELALAGNLAVKLSRTFTLQMEALAKLRRKGEQTVRVEHVHVYQGGQAVVGNVALPGGGGVFPGDSNQPHEAGDARTLVLASGAPVWSEKPGRKPMPAGGIEGEDEM